MLLHRLIYKGSVPDMATVSANEVLWSGAECTFKDKGTLFWGVVLENKTTFHDILRGAVPENECTFSLD